MIASLSRLLFIALFAVSCSGSESKPSAVEIMDSSRPYPRVGEVIGGPASRHGAWGHNGAVATEHRLASEAALEILKAGGNAVDAAVAAALATGVVNPSSSGLGGGGFLVVYLAEQQLSVALDFRERAPAGAHRDLYVNQQTGEVNGDASRRGGLAVGVPGEPLGYETALKRFGTMTTAQVAAPARRLAELGFPTGNHLAKSIVRNQAALAANATLAAVFLHEDQSPLAEGERLVRPDLARTLAVFADAGAKPFYEGEIAADIVASVQASGGILRAEDLSSYRVLEREPVSTRFGAFQILGMPPPSSGGGTIAAALAVIAQLESNTGWPHRQLPDLGSDPSPETTGNYAHLLAETLKAVFADRAVFYGDADQVDVPLQWLTSKQHTDQIAAAIDPEHAAPAERWGNALPPRDAGTTHISVIDKQGNAVALTTSVNTAFGAKLSVAGRDILLNNTMDDFSLRPGVPNHFGLVGAEANAVGARKRPLSSMSPTIVLKDGKVRLAAGGSGGPRIITGTLQALLAILLFDADAETAVAAKRLHHQWRPDRLELEAPTSASLREQLERRGHEIKTLGGGIAVQVVEVVETESGQRLLRAASDPRKGGEAAAY